MNKKKEAARMLPNAILSQAYFTGNAQLLAQEKVPWAQ